MKDFRDIGAMRVTYLIDQKHPGKKGRCKGCGLPFSDNDEKITVVSSTVRITLCFRCSLKLARAIREILGYV